MHIYRGSGVDLQIMLFNKESETELRVRRATVNLEVEKRSHEVLDDEGIDPSASRMLSERSTI